MSTIKKFTFYTLSFLTILSTTAFVPSNVKAAGCDNPAGFVTMNIQIDDLLSGEQGGGVATSMPGGEMYGNMNYTEGGDVYIELTGGGNGQADNPVHVQVSGFNSDEGNTIEFDDFGRDRPGFTGTFHHFNAGTITAIATQCAVDTATVYLTMNPISTPTPTFTCTVTQDTATVDPGGSTSYTINTTPQGGFNSPVTFSTGFSPSSGTPPTVTSYGNNGQVPPSTTTANIGTTSNTTAGAYTLTFTGNGGGQTSTCNTQLVVNPSAKDFQLTIAPSTTVLPNGIGTNTNPNRSNIGVNVIFDVFADCTGGFAGPITAMTASITFTGPTLTLGATQLNCGTTTTLTVSNTASIPTDQQSVMPYNIFPQDIKVTGSGQL